MSNSTLKICPKCKGKKWYQYDDVHSKFCEVCCKHEKGYWLLPEGYSNAGRYCCLAGCGHTITPKKFKKISNSTQNGAQVTVQDGVQDTQNDERDIGNY